MKTVLKGAVCALILTLSASLCSCSETKLDETKPESISFEAMDTVMTLQVYGGNDNTVKALKDRILSLDELLDATDENSEIYKLNQERSARVSDDTSFLLHESISLCRDFDGNFDITVYPAVQAWGFTTGDYKVPDDDELKALAENINYGSIRFNDSDFSFDGESQIDLGAVAKGFAADECWSVLFENDAQAAVLNLGGTICLYGEKPDGSRFTVGVADPDEPASYFGTLNCSEGFIATSGGYERYFEQDGKRYIHILDPKTAKPVDNGILSVTIITDSGTFASDSGILADAASTALFVMGLDKATEYYRKHPHDFDFIILTDDDNLYITDGVYDDFTLCDGYDFTLKRISAM